MGTVEKIAIRNLREHKAKTLIIGILMAVGICVMVLSNSILDSAEKGSKEVFIENYTAHLLVSKKLEGGKMSVFGYEQDFSNISFSGDVPNPVIPEYKKVYEYLNTIEGVKAVNSQNAGASVTIKFDETFDEGAFTLLWGINPTTYKNMFTENIEMVSGNFLNEGEQGILLNEKLIEDVKETLDRDIVVGDKITLQAMTGRLHEVEVRGIFRFLNGSGTVSVMSLIDVESYRILAKMLVGTTDTIEVEEDATTLLEEELDFDSMFSDSLDVADTTDSVDYDSVLGDLSQREVLTQPSVGTWNFSLLMLDKRSDIPRVKAEIEAWAVENELDLQVQTWEDAAGTTGDMINQAKGAINVFIIIVSIVTVIIIMNTLVVSIMERTSEIGTMRAIGGQKGFIRRLFITESMSIAIVFGTVGIIIAGIVLLVLNNVGISFQGNELLEALFAGDVLYPVTTVGTIISAYLVTIFIGLISSLYPVSIALKISPIKAIQS